MSGHVETGGVTSGAARADSGGRADSGERDDIEELVEQSVRDGLLVRRVSVPMRDVVYLKSILEGYEGMNAVFATRRARGEARAADAERALNVVFPPECEADIDALLEELSARESRGVYSARVTLPDAL